MPAAPRLTRQAWVDAALAAWAEGGVERVAVEPLARRLGTTKGSFYWHFADRAELVDAALTHWEQDATLAIIDQARAAPTAERLGRLVEVVFADRGDDALERQIFAASELPRVAPVIARVHRARLAYLRELFAERGLGADRADARARISYATYLGGLHLAGDGASPTLRLELVALLSQP